MRVKQGVQWRGFCAPPPKTKTKTCASKEEQTQVEDSRSPSPTPLRMAESSGLCVDAAVESEAKEDANTLRGRAGNTPHMSTRIHTVEEGRTYLEECHLMEPEDVRDSKVLAGTLAQISLFPGMSQAMRDAVRAVAFLLTQEKPVDPGDMAVEGIID